MSVKVYEVHDWVDVERICPDDVKHYKTKELLVDYDSYAKLEAERDAYKEKLDKVNSLRQSCEDLAAIDGTYAEFAGIFTFLDN